MSILAAIFSLFIIICLVTVRGLAAFRSQSLWERRKEIEKAVFAFYHEQSGSPESRKPMFSGEQPDTVQGWHEFDSLMVTWRHAISLANGAAKGINFLEILPTREVKNFSTFVDEQIYLLAGAVRRIMQSDELSGYVFHGQIVANDDLLKYLHRFNSIGSDSKMSDRPFHRESETTNA